MKIKLTKGQFEDAGTPIGNGVRFINIHFLIKDTEEKGVYEVIPPPEYFPFFLLKAISNPWQEDNSKRIEQPGLTDLLEEVRGWIKEWNNATFGGKTPMDFYEFLDSLYERYNVTLKH